jgi:lipopolysaccharide transport system ATP-binding protein
MGCLPTGSSNLGRENERMSNSEILVKAENVSKKFCRSLKKSLWYGMKDIGAELVGQNRQRKLRTEEFWAVTNVSFELSRGECIGLIGRNGAGKSTLLKMLNGLIKPDKGRITVRGRVGALIELGAGFNPILTGRENIYINAAVLGIRKQEVDKKLDPIIEFAEIGDFINTPVQYYSSGMRVRLGFAVAAQLEPDVLFIDEVLAVGDLGFKIKCLNAVNELMRNSAVIFVSHSMQFISWLCTKVMVLNAGKVEFSGNDVPAGIDYYYTRFERPDQTVSGSGKAVISDVQVFSGQRRASAGEMLLLNYGDDLSIQMGLSLDSLVSQPAIRIVIWDQELRPVVDCFSPFSGFEINPKSSSRIKLHLINLQLNMGVYSIAIVVVDLSNNCGEVLSRIDHAAHFQVKTTYTSWAPVLLRGEWKAEEC